MSDKPTAWREGDDGWAFERSLRPVRYAPGERQAWAHVGDDGFGGKAVQLTTSMPDVEQAKALGDVLLGMVAAFGAQAPADAIRGLTFGGMLHSLEISGALSHEAVVLLQTAHDSDVSAERQAETERIAEWARYNVGDEHMQQDTGGGVSFDSFALADAILAQGATVKP
jgi:hypothetical protein